MVAVLTVHNRRPLTQRCLALLDIAAAEAGVDLRRIIVDDGSTDGTAELLAGLRRDTDVVVRGDGRLFWSGGMRRGLSELAGLEPWDQVLLLNDDVALAAGGLTALLDRATGRHDLVVAGHLVDPDSGEVSYGGWRGRSPRRPFGYSLVREPDGGPVETCNGNALLVGHEAYDRLGGLSAAFRHGFSDFDLGLRANAGGIGVVLPTTVIGTCARNPVAGTWRDPALPRLTRLRLMNQPTGMPLREWTLFAWRHGKVAGLRYVGWDLLQVLRGR